MFGPDRLHGELAGGMLRHLLQGTLGYVGYEVLEPYCAWHVPYCSPEDRQRLMAGWENYLHTLEQQPRLAMPDLGRYDDIFWPLASSPHP